MNNNSSCVTADAILSPPILGTMFLAIDVNLTDGNSTSPESLTGASTGWVPLDNYGVTTITGLAATNVTLSSLLAAKERIVLTGTLISNIAIIFPAWMTSWTVVNNCTGAFTVTCRTASGSGITAATGTTEKLYCDGVNITRDFGTTAQRNVGDGSGNIPDMSFFASSKTANGSQDLPGGLVMQWGSGSTASGASTVNISFPKPFSSVPFSMIVTDTGSSAKAYGVSALSASGATISSISAGTSGFRYLAIGNQRE